MFEYLGVLIAVIMGLALTHLLRGLAKLIHMRRTAKLWWPHIVWTFNVLIYVLAIWWGMYWWNGLRDWTFQQFLFIAVYCSVLFLQASLLYPPECPEDMDFERHFFDNKNWFFSVALLALLLDVPETLGKSVVHLRDVPTPYIFFIPFMVALCVVGIVSKSRVLHGVLAIIWSVALVGYVILSSMDRIAVH
jgi:hypothetical protein